jgi:hypothetical protein
VPTGVFTERGVDARDAKALEEIEGWLGNNRDPRDEQRPNRQGDLHADVEMVALAAGLRTATRALIPADQLGPVRTRYERAGLAAVVATAGRGYGPEPHVIVYGGRTEADARLALEAENTRDGAELGRLLGYPPCCIGFFTRARHPDQFEAARAAWVARPAPRLNTLLFGCGVRFISFEPCRFDCPRAIETADAIANALTCTSPASTARCDVELSQSVAIDATNARAVVSLNTSGCITSARPVPSVRDRPVPGAALALAERLVGARVGADGRLRHEGAPETVVVDFGWEAR